MASGRNYRKLMKYAMELKMKEYGGYLIEANGLAIYSLEDDVRQVFNQLDKAAMSQLFEAVKPFDVEVLCAQDDGIYDYFSENVRLIKQQYRLENNIAEDCPWTAGHLGWIQDNRVGYPNLVYFNQAKDLPEHANKFCIAQKPEVVNQCYEYLLTNYQDKFEIVRTSPRWCEVTMKGISKGDALCKLMREMNLQKEDVICFGDGENDISMFRKVHYSVAMKNAMDTVKQAANYETEDNDHDGIVQALEKLSIK